MLDRKIILWVLNFSSSRQTLSENHVHIEYRYYPGFGSSFHWNVITCLKLNWMIFHGSNTRLLNKITMYQSYHLALNK